MALDRAAYIGQMDTNIPANTDARAEGAGQIRSVKTAVQNTFPVLNGEINYTEDQFNAALSAVLGGPTSTNPVGAIPVGLISMWSGQIVDVPAGWALCDGEIHNSVQTPNLKGRFVVGYDSEDDDYLAIGNTGGKKMHDHGGETGGYQLVEDDIPAHDHSSNVIVRHGDNTGQENPNITYEDEDAAWVHKNTWEHHKTHDNQKIPRTSEFGKTSNDPHKHEISEEDNRPDYFVIAYIMYVGI